MNQLYVYIKLICTSLAMNKYIQIRCIYIYILNATLFTAPHLWHVSLFEMQFLHFI